MADPRHSPPRPPRPKPPTPTPTAGKSPNKRKTTADAASSPANKHPNRAPPSAADIEDTATSKGKGKKVLQEVDLDDIEVYERILEYRNKKGVFPFESPAAMKNFLLPWIILCIGNEAGWKMKLEHVKNKFTKDSAPIQDEERKEFDLWKKIWGNEVEGGDEYDPTGGS